MNQHKLVIRSIRAMHGANYFSGGKVIVMQLDLGDFDEVFTNEIPGFYEKLKRLVPSLYDHHCSPGIPGGFFQRVQRGTLLGHVTEHTAIELQTLAGMDVGFGKTRETTISGVYNVVVRFADEIAGKFACEKAVELINSILQDQEFDVDTVIKKLILIREDRLLGPSTSAIVQEAQKREIPFLRLDEHNLIQLGTGKYQKKLRATITSDTNYIAIETADNKYLSNLMLHDAGIPVPKTKIIETEKDIITFCNTSKKDLVVKPVFGSSGVGITKNISSKRKVKQAFKWAKKYSDQIIAQEQIPGSTYRLLVIDFKFIAAVKQIPATIIGDGKSSISELIEKMNSDPKRLEGDIGRLNTIKIDDNTLEVLKQNKLKLDSILPEAKSFELKISANLKNGGIALDVTDQVHPMNQYFAERASKAIGLNVAGVDFVCDNIRDSILENNGKIIEVNAAPDFRQHLKPTHGKDRNVAKPLVNMLFPDDTKKRIPAISVTGTYGKTKTANLLSSCLMEAGLRVGKTTSEGFFINDNKLITGNLTHTKDARLALKDPTIDVAILETSLEGILEGGLGYEFVDFGIVLNIYDTYQFSNLTTYLDDLDDVAYAKSVVAEQVYTDGFTILNADDDLVESMRKRLYSNLILISTQKNNPKIISHIKRGGIAYLEEDAEIWKYHKHKKHCFLKKTFTDIKNISDEDKYLILATIALLDVFGVEKEYMQRGFKKYYNSTRKVKDE